MKLYNYVVPTKQMKGFKALVVSDLHYSGYEDNARMIDILLELDDQNYDAVFIVGDIIDSTNVLKEEGSQEFLVDFMKILGSFIPTYIAYGEHDISKQDSNNPKLWVSDKIVFMRDFLNKIAGFPGIHIAANNVYDIARGYTVSIINPSVEQALNSINGKREMLEKSLITCNYLKALRKNDTNTLLCHDPRTIIYLYILGYLDNVDLSLCGYTHGGYAQFKYFPVEGLLNLFNKNKGLVEPLKPAILENITLARGQYDFDKMKMIINPAMNPLPKSMGKIRLLDPLFYKSASVINYEAQKEFTRTRK